MEYDEAIRQINRLKALPPPAYDDEPEPPSEMNARAALSYIGHLFDSGEPMPDCIYTFPDGNICLQWEFEDRVEQLEIEGLGYGDLMVCYKDRSKKTTFETVKWRHD